MKQNSLLYYLLAGALLGLLLVLFLFLYFPPYDYSYRQTANRRTFGSVMQTLSDPYYVAMDDKLRALAESRGDVLISRDARQRGDKQLDQIYELIAMKPDGIFVSAVDWDKIVPALEEARRMGVPVIALDAPSDLELVAATVSTDPHAAGRLCAEDLQSQLDGGEILVLDQPGNEYSESFMQGFRESLGENYIIADEADGNRQLAQSSIVCASMLEDHAEADAVIAVNDQSAIGALASLERVGLDGKLLLYGVDGSPQARAAVKKGLMRGTVARYPYELAQAASDAMYALLEEDEPAAPHIAIDISIINQENIADYDTTSWQ